MPSQWTGRVVGWLRDARRDLGGLGRLPGLVEDLLADDAAVLKALVELGKERLRGERPAAAGPAAEGTDPAPPGAPASGEDKNVLYDRWTAEIMKRTLAPDSVCIDVGAHTGEMLRLMMARAPRGKFYAFEPLPHLVAGLRATFPSDRVQILDIALSDRTGTATFNHVVTNPGYSGLLRRHYDRPDEQDAQITVRTQRLDELVDPAERVAFIKIDVEGAELQVMRGAVETIRRSQPVMVFEHGLGAADCYGTQPEDVYELLTGQCGLAVSTLDGWLAGAPPLARAAFADEFRSGRNFYFLAHPPRGA